MCHHAVSWSHRVHDYHFTVRLICWKEIERERKRGTVPMATQNRVRERASCKKNWVRRPLARNSNAHQRCFMCECMNVEREYDRERERANSVMRNDESGRNECVFNAAVEFYLSLT